jgi:hypothetical protein
MAAFSTSLALPRFCTAPASIGPPIKWPVQNGCPATKRIRFFGIQYGAIRHAGAQVPVRRVDLYNWYMASDILLSYTHQNGPRVVFLGFRQVRAPGRQVRQNAG